MTLKGHRAISTRLRRGVEDAVDNRMAVVISDIDGATMSLGRGTEYLTVLQRHILRVHSDIAPDRLWATGH